MIEKVSKIVALVVATIGAGTTIYNTFLKSEYGRKQAYYEDLLKPFLVAYKKNPNMNTIKFVKNKVERDNDNIPKYIFYLIEENATQSEEMCACTDAQKQYGQKQCKNNSDILRKVLMVDYSNLYLNECNKKRNLLEKVSRLINNVMFSMVFICVLMGGFMITVGVHSFITEIFSDHCDWLQCFEEVIKGVIYIFVGLIPMKLYNLLTDDMYTIKKRQIQKKIKEKVRRYDKHFDNYII